MFPPPSRQSVGLFVSGAEEDQDVFHSANGKSNTASIMSRCSNAVGRTSTGRQGTKFWVFSMPRNLLEKGNTFAGMPSSWLATIYLTNFWTNCRTKVSDQKPP